jgi:hypothetical protein
MALVGSPAFVTHNGPQLNLLNEAGQASRAWPDWYAPATRIWIENYDYRADYSADGMLVQFDNGTIWQGIAASTATNKVPEVACMRPAIECS